MCKQIIPTISLADKIPRCLTAGRRAHRDDRLRLYIGGIEKGGAAALFYPFTSCHADLKSTSTFISFIPSFSCYKSFWFLVLGLHPPSCLQLFIFFTGCEAATPPLQSCLQLFIFFTPSFSPMFAQRIVVPV
jgi:hypothetical protein